MNSSRQNVLSNCEKVMDAAERRLNDFLNGKSGERYGTTKLSQDVASEIGVSFSFAFALISDYINGRDDIESRKGPKGGFRIKEVAK